MDRKKAIEEIKGKMSMISSQFLDLDSRDTGKYMYLNGEYRGLETALEILEA